VVITGQRFCTTLLSVSSPPLTIQNITVFIVLRRNEQALKQTQTDFFFQSKTSQKYVILI